MLTTVSDWFERTFVDLFQQMRWSFLPPLMVYFAAGISALTAIVGTFFVKEYLGLSAEFLAALSFWARTFAFSVSASCSVCWSSISTRGSVGGADT